VNYIIGILFTKPFSGNSGIDQFRDGNIRFLQFFALEKQKI